MAKIDLRHLIKSDHDTIEFIGSADKKEYSLPLLKTTAALLYMQSYMEAFRGKKPEEYSVSDKIECAYITVCSWIKAFYPDVSLEWARENLSDELLEILSGYANDLFFPKPREAAKPEKKPAKRSKKARRS